MDALDTALHILLSESQMYRKIPFPDNAAEKRTLLRTLLNVRPPYPVNEDFLKAQDAELQRQMAEKGIVALSDIEPCRKDRRLRLWQGDITRLQVDAIVNAANSALLGCFVPMHRCIDNAIHSAAGVQLRLACDRLIQAQGYPEPTGRAKITDGYNLPARYVLHTVGPIVRDDTPTPKQEQELEDCYNSCLALADAHGLQSIAFCCISTGEFGFPQVKAAQIAVGTVRATQGRFLDITIGNINMGQNQCSPNPHIAGQERPSMWSNCFTPYKNCVVLTTEQLQSMSHPIYLRKQLITTIHYVMT